jgi:membrane fusion protein, copper/silver efflux system
MRNFLLGFVMAAILIGGGYLILTRLINRQPSVAPQKTAARYHCPMHPEYISDKPGDCPICGMKLVPIESSETEQSPAPMKTGHGGEKTVPGKEKKILYYTDAMNPGSRFDRPGKAPDGMDLVPVYTEEAEEESASAVPGYAIVRVAPERRQMMGITVEEARVMDFVQSIRTVGRVTIDETRLHHVHTKFEGFIEEIFLNFIGQEVSVGQPLFSIYSPELLATEREYLLALRAQEQMARSGQGANLPGVNLLESARQRLALWDIGQEQIEQLEQTRQPVKNVIMRSPVSGFVSAKTAVQGMRIMPSDSAYDITDLSVVWIMADIYEANLASVRIGQPASVQLPYQPGQVWKGHINYIDPTLDAKTRTVKARIELSNPDGIMKPDMYAEVELNASMGRGLAVPESTVIATGERYIVFVSKGEGVYEPREVKIGVKVRGYYQIEKGLSAGEMVATEANFLLDSESKLKASISGTATSSEHKP